MLRWHFGHVYNLSMLLKYVKYINLTWKGNCKSLYDFSLLGRFDRCEMVRFELIVFCTIKAPVVHFGLLSNYYLSHLFICSFRFQPLSHLPFSSFKRIRSIFGAANCHKPCFPFSGQLVSLSAGIQQKHCQFAKSLCFLLILELIFRHVKIVTPGLLSAPAAAANTVGNNAPACLAFRKRASRDSDLFLQ